MTDHPRPSRIADLFWLTAAFAFCFGIALPAYCIAFGFNPRVSNIDYGWLGPVCLLATVGVVAVPTSLFVIGAMILRSNGSVVTRSIGIAVLLNALPAGFACASVGRACAFQLTG